MADNNPPEVSSTAVINLNARMASITENSSGYPPFNLCLISIYMNNQLCYYHMTGVMLNADKAAIKNQLKDHKALLELINWDGNTRENISVEHNPSSQIP